MEFYKLELKEIYKSLESSENGLGEKEAKSRLEKFGYNKLEAKKKISPFLIFLGEFNDPVVWVLLGALVISSITGYLEYQGGGITLLEFIAEPAVIGIIVVINAVIGFIQEYKAEKSIEALKR